MFLLTAEQPQSDCQQRRFSGKPADGTSRTIAVSKTGSASTVIWNPWIAKAQRMPDFGDDEWPGMACIETANVDRNAITLGYEQSHTMSVTIEAT